MKCIISLAERFIPETDNKAISILVSMENGKQKMLEIGMPFDVKTLAAGLRNLAMAIEND